MSHPYLPQTPEDSAAMLERIGASSVQELLEEIPEELRLRGPLNLPTALSEMELKEYFQALADLNASTGRLESYLGGGAYEHFHPAVVRHLIARSEFYTSYTPYQPEMTQGALQAIFEYQTCICALTGMEVSNASLYEGGHALAEACFMARAHTGRNKVVLCAGVHPEYIQVLRTHMRSMETEILLAPQGPDGASDVDALGELAEGASAVVGQNPNFFGCLEPMAEIAAKAQAKGALAVAAAEPVSLALLKSPGECGFDIACGEGQSLGLPLSYGGPGLGFLAAHQALLRRMPGRICGQTLDSRGQRGFVLTLQTREQHIRREKANSNICTNQTLLAIAAAIHLAALGPQGLREVAEQGAWKAHYLAELLREIPGLTLPYRAPFFNEFTLRLPVEAAGVLEALRSKGILAGIPLSRFFPSNQQDILVCVTETKKKAQLARYAEEMRTCLKSL